MNKSPKFKVGDVVKLPFTPLSIQHGKKGAFTTISTSYDKQIRLYDLAEILSYNAETHTYNIRIRGVTSKETIEIKGLAANFVEEDCIQDTIQTMRNLKKDA